MQVKATAVTATVQAQGDESKVTIIPGGADTFGEYHEPRMIVDGVVVEWDSLAAKIVRQAIKDSFLG